MEYLGCRVCEDPLLVLTAGHDGQSHYRWRLTCGNGHEWVAVPGTVLTLSGFDQDAEEYRRLLDERRA